MELLDKRVLRWRLLVGKDFPVPERREFIRQDPSLGSGRATSPAADIRFAEFPCVFPVDQCRSAKRTSIPAIEIRPTSVESEQCPLLRPVKGKINPFRQLFGGEIYGLGSGNNPRDDIGCQESKRDQVGHVSIGDTFGLGRTERYRGFKSHSLRHSVLRRRDFARAVGNSPRKLRDSAGSWPSSPRATEPETAGSGHRRRSSAGFSPSASWAVRIRF
jgi:hypothetical protein